MKKIAYMPLSLAFSLLLLGGCGGEKKAETKENSEVIKTPQFLEPDSYFEKAIEYLDAGDKNGAIEQIAAAVEYINSIEVQSDTIHTEIIEFSISSLSELSDGILDGSITSSEPLRDEFSSIDRSLGTYHLRIIEAWIANETNDQKSLRRMHKALVRTSFALDHAGLQLTELEQQELDKAKKDVLEAEKATLTLWQKVRATIKKYNNRLQENSNR
ncbi:MAG: hypothetical protein ABJF04_16090 [Reichenbachiella sp.]|uniref:hypothetical protein n=1 Tax=Reichenbachiella sp. TaxID=2184521 RepID=UPI00326728EB